MAQVELFDEDVCLTDSDPRKHCDRLFLAILPEAETAARIEMFSQGFHQQLGFERGRQAVARQHVSVMLLGDYSRLKAKHVYAAAVAARAIDLPAFDLIFDTVGSFPGAPATATAPAHRPLVLRASSPEMLILINQLRRALRRKAVPANRELVPHLTLSYGPELTRWQPILPIRIAARELVLIHSEVGLSRYHILERWPFGDGLLSSPRLRAA